MPLWVYLKTLQAAAVHNNKSVGEREERQEEGRGRRSRDGEEGGGEVVRNILDFSCEKLTVK